MDPVSWIGLILIFALTTFSALLVMSESAAHELTRTALAHLDGTSSATAVRIRILLDNRFRLWVSARLGTTLLAFGSAALAATTIGDELEGIVASRAGGVVLSIAILAVIHAVFALIAPRILAQRYPAQIVDRFSLLLFGQYLLFVPATRLLERMLSPAEKEAWRGPDPEDEAVIEAVEEGARDGTIDEQDVEMITNVIALGDRVVRQVMTPRPDIVAVADSTPLRDALHIAHERGVSRLPVFGADLDHVIGIIHVRDGLAELLEPDQPENLRSLVREPLFVPDSKHADHLFREMQAAKVHMAIVVNEYGETAGLVTIEDLLEEIVGEIEDEYDVPDTPIESVSPGCVVVDASLPITDLNEELGLNLQTFDVDTVGGLAFSAFGRVPTIGESVNVDGAILRVHDINENRITRLMVNRVTAADPNDA